MTTENPSKTQVVTAGIAVVLLISLALVGAIVYGISPEVNRRIWTDIFNRPSGPMSFRFILQPVMAIVAALHDGIKDARTGRSPYLWTMFTSAAQRGGRFSEGLIAVGRILLIGLVMDTIYQVTVLKTFYPGEAAILTTLLAFVPYVVLRGPITRVARRFVGRNKTTLKGAGK